MSTLADHETAVKLVQFRERLNKASEPLAEAVNPVTVKEQQEENARLKHDLFTAHLRYSQLKALWDQQEAIIDDFSVPIGYGHFTIRRLIEDAWSEEPEWVERWCQNCRHIARFCTHRGER